MCELTGTYSPLDISTNKLSAGAPDLVQSITLPNISNAAKCTFTHNYAGLPTGVTADPSTNELTISRSGTAIGTSSLTVTPNLSGVGPFSDKAATINIHICKLSGGYSPSSIHTYYWPSDPSLKHEVSISLPTVNLPLKCTFTHLYSTPPAGVTIDQATHKVTVSRSAVVPSTSFTITPQFDGVSDTSSMGTIAVEVIDCTPSIDLNTLTNIIAPPAGNSYAMKEAESGTVEDFEIVINQ